MAWVRIHEFFLSHKEKRFYFMKNIDEVRAMNKIEVNLSQEKIKFINDAYQKDTGKRHL